MKNQWKIFAVVLSSVLLFGCDQLTGKKDLEDKVISLTESVNMKDQEILKLQADLAALQALVPPSKLAAAAASELSGKQVQTALKQAGFDPGPIDGKLGVNSKEALKLFQQSVALNPDGNLTPETIQELKKHL